MTNLEMVKNMLMGSRWIVAPNVDGNNLMIAIHRKPTGFQIQTTGDEADVRKWLQEEYKEPKGE